MLFSNKKEDVIDLKLTTHGRRLLSDGVFKPVYYSFFDDNILYDASRVSGSAAEPSEGIVGNLKTIFKKESKRKHHILRYNITFLVERSKVKTQNKQQKERKTIF